jgi:hypothetical protein
MYYEPNTDKYGAMAYVVTTPTHPMPFLTNEAVISPEGRLVLTIDMTSGIKTNFADYPYPTTKRDSFAISTIDIARFSVVGDTMVQDFLARCPDVKSDLNNAVPVIEHVFGVDSELTLVVSPDIENNGDERLMCFVHTRMERTAANRNLKVVYDELSTLDSLSNEKLDISLRFEK